MKNSLEERTKVENGTGKPLREVQEEAVIAPDRASGKGDRQAGSKTLLTLRQS